MGFLAPLMLAGTAAVAVPIGLHFFYKARYRPHPWAAMRFLKQSIEQTSRRLKFQEWILLALRCLVLLLLALALARPTASTVAAGGRGEAIDAILVFDTSYSMGARDGELTRFERAKAAAITVIDNLPPHSTVQVIGNSDRATNLGPQTPANLDMARQIVNGLTLTSLAGEILPGLSETHAALDRGSGTNKEVYLFTDLQKAGWLRQEGAVKAKANEIKQRATLVVVRCGNPDRPVRNLQVADISFPVSIPHTGTRLPVTVLLKNTGLEAVRGVTVSLEVDGKKQEKETAAVEEVKPGHSEAVTITAKLEEAGPRLLTAMIQSDDGTVQFDDLPGDNRLDRIVPVRDRIRVLIVDGAPDRRDPTASASHFLRNALLPVSEAQLGSFFVRVDVVPPDEAQPGLLKDSDVCYLANVALAPSDRPGTASLPPDFAVTLPGFVKNGGGLVISAGSNVVPESYRSVLGSGGQRLMPFDFGEVQTAPKDRPFKPAPDTADASSWLGSFRNEPYSTAVQDVEILKVLSGGSPVAGGRVLLRLADQTPLVASKPHGTGDVVVVSTSFDAAWSNWPAKGSSFLSFQQQLLSHLTSKNSAGANRTAGQPLVWHPADAPRDFVLIRPDRTRSKLGKAVGTDPRTVTATDVQVAGVYQMGLEGEEPPSGPRFAVAPDLAETDDISCLTDGETERAVGFKPVLILAGNEGDSNLADERNRREWTVWVLLLAFAAACAEMAWAWFCGRAR